MKAEEGAWIGRVRASAMAGWTTTGLVLLLALFACGCGPAAPPVHLSAAWAAGQTANYDVLDQKGHVTGTASFAWHRDGTGWKSDFALHRRGKHRHSGIRLDAALRPRSSLVIAGTTRTRADYGAKTIAIKKTAKGKTTRTTLARPAHAVDNDAALAVLSGLPLSDGYAGTFHNVVTASTLVVPARVRVTGKKSIDVPAGHFETWHVRLQLGPGTHEAWYATAPPHLLVRYRNPSGSVFVLRSYRLRAGAPLQGNASEPHIAPPAPLRVSWTIIALTLLVQLPLMIGLPLVLGWQIHKRTKASYALWAFGALTFLASQIVHLPLNWALGMLGTPRAIGLWPLPALALAAGLSAGLCEEVARYVTVRLLLRGRPLGFADGLELGAGHGGIEAMILGFLSAVAFVFMLAMVWFPGLAAHLGAPATTLRSAARHYWSMAWTTPLVGGLERVSALAAHLGLNVLVVRAGVKRRIGWLGAAIAGHAALDAYAVWAARELGTLWTELGVAAIAAVILVSAFSMRKSLAATA